MPHLSPMSWLLAIITFWTTMLLFTSNTWWSNLHMFETDSHTYSEKLTNFWQWSLRDGWE
uniref:ATPase 8 n=1 Tax=Terrisswalkerius phalacrus TaxID=169918 RepID=Q94VP1_9ANNE|nr:ATPase 8 [Terrisswalkerius phalacrus]